MAATKTTINGGCHCGFIRYEFDLPGPITDEQPLVATRCNCTFCNKLSTTNYSVPGGAANFRLLSPPGGRAALAAYAPRNKALPRYFCATCSALVFMEGTFEHEGMRVAVFAVNLASVDQPQPAIDLSKVKMKYYDLLNMNYAAGTREVPWPCGLL